MSIIEPRMLEGINKKSGAIFGAYDRGEFCVIGGAFVAAQVAGLNMGQAEAGMIQLVRATGGNQNKAGQVFAIDKQTHKHEEGDSSYDTLVSGDQVIYYQGPGMRLAVDTYSAAVISGGTTVGTELYVNGSGWLDTSGGAAANTMAPIAILVGHEAVGTTKFFNDTALYTKDMIVIEML